MIMARCVTCGTELHPERARKYDYCTAPACQEKNFKGLTMVAVGMNKAAEELLILDDQTREDMASGKFRDQRRGTYGKAARPAEPASAAARTDRVGAAGSTGSQSPATRAHRRAAQPQKARPAERRLVRPPWTKSQERLALLYNEQGMRPEEIATKLGISRYLATQIVLAARNRKR
jgi:hypothetical protein